MTDLGVPVSHLTLQKGMPVLSRQHEQVGTLHVVVADPGADAFDALVIQENDRLHVALAEEVESIHESAVVLALDTKSCQRLPAPEADPVAAQASARDRLRRAWEQLTGGT